ncbi:MAG: Stk1 family PASTA domain-containing Ser/Thr kinase [Clostridiales bacterium]|nr:Stk1 family PASTA domain-containing Ser/Thr kinase [Clostridiales bacterium]
MENNSMDRYLGQMLDNRYELLEIIGSGGMAVVYRALCHRLNRYVAVKILKDEYAQDDEFREHFKAESQAVAMLSHPNIVSVYDFSKSSECQYIVMELLDGITLKQYMQTKGALSWKEALHFSTQIAKALSHAHSKGIVHRDIKPQNIMVVKDGSIKVADFGIAHLQNESNADENETVGSIHYISPEQARGEPVDTRSDIYSLGIVMYEMLTGRLPYEGDSAEAIAVQHINAMLTLPGDINPDIPMRLEEITLKAMTADLNSRYQTADELQDDLEAFRKHMNIMGADTAGASGADAIGKAVNRGKTAGKGGSLSKKERRESKKRSRKVGSLTGAALIGVFLVALVFFIWSFWLRDIFSEGQRVEIPDFIGQNSDEIVNSEAYADIFNFKVTYSISQDYEKGVIIDQNPEAGRSVVPGKNGFDIELIVSAELVMTEIPDLINHEYREATIELEKLGFEVEVEIVASDTITKDYVVSSNPKAGEKLPANSKVYLFVSGGTDIDEVSMPDLSGYSKYSAVTTLSSLGLSVGSISYVDSNNDKDIVVWQSVTAGQRIAKGSVVYLQISKGPQATPTPSPTPTPTPSPAVEPSATPEGVSDTGAE